MTSKSRSEPEIPLSIQAPDQATEIFLVSNRFERIGRSIGTLEKKVPPGLYKIRLRSGMTQQDKLVEVSPAQPKVTVKTEPVCFESTTPLANTLTGSVRQRSIAQKQSTKIHIRSGAGSRLFLFLRHRDDDTTGNPGEGVTLHSLEGTLLARMEDGHYSKEAGCCCMGVELDPGTYRLRVDTGPLGTFEMFVVACKNWQTMLFGLTSDFSRRASDTTQDRLTRLLLKSVSVHIVTIGEAFNPASESFRLTELAKIGLENGRKVVSASTFKRVFTDTITNPMFGIYGAHQLLLDRKPAYKVIDAVAQKLQKLIGPHPDVLSLWLRGTSNRKPKTVPAFPSPPMLTRSWELITRASLRRISVVPEKSFSDLLSNSLLTSTPWLLHRLTEEPGKESSGTSFAKTMDMLGDLAEISSTDKGYSMLSEALRQRKDLTELEYRIVQTLLDQVRYPLPQKDEKTESRSFSLNALVENIKAPTVALKRSAMSLFDKLDLTGKE